MRTRVLQVRGFGKAWLVVLGFFSTQAFAVDVSVGTIEVTQATQTPANAIQLVAGRSTAVRATLGVADSAVPVAGISGVLQVFVDGTEITPPGGVPAINAPFTAPLAPNRANQNDTLNFELAAPTGITASTNVDFVVILSVPDDTNPFNDAGLVSDLSFEDRQTPLIFFTRIDYTPSGLGLPDLATIAPGVGDAFVRGIYPVNDADPQLYQAGLFPTLPFSGDSDGDGLLEGCPGPPADADDLLTLLEACRQLIVDSGVGASDRIFLYGWLAGNPIAPNGCGAVGGRVAFGNTEASRYQRTFAHELGHNFGFNHPDGGVIDQIGWDVLARLPGNPAGNATTGRVKPLTLSDIMTPGLVTNQAWIKTANYNTLLAAAPLMPDAEPGGDLVPQVLVVRGIFDPSGGEVIRLLPSFRFPWLSRPSPSEIIVPVPFQGVGPKSTGPRKPCSFSVEVRDSFQRLVRTEGSSLVGDDAFAEGCGSFTVMVPVAPQTRAEALQIRGIDGEVVRTVIASATAPSVAIVEPLPGATLPRMAVVRWEVEDSDSVPGDLMFQVAYSPDNGNSFVPIGVDLQATELTFDSTQVASSQGSGLIRVFVSDGLNASFADLKALSTVPSPPDCNSNGVDDALDISGGASQDVNVNGFPDECEVGEFPCTFTGTAQGGQVSVTLSGFTGTCIVAIVTTAGQSASEVAANLAAAINADACTSGQGISATASGGTIRMVGFLLEFVGSTVTDQGLQHSIPVVVPTLSTPGALVMASLLLLAGIALRIRQRRGAARFW